MDELEDNSIQCVVTSPPYWGLRKYSGEQELIWGNKDCEHQWAAEIVEHDNLRFRGEHSIVGNEKNPNIHTGKQTAAGFCSLCGAWKVAYGLEPTPEMYIEHTILILREIRRVLRKDGVVFWNIGDSYYGSGQGASTNPDVLINAKEVYNIGKRHNKTSSVLKPKDLCLIPFRVAIACQQDGWWVRSVIIWSKPNPMPESCIDRPTESHEYILMLTKSKNYYWDASAVRERGLVDSAGTTNGALLSSPAITNESQGRNIRSVWTFPTFPYPLAHFAVFPEKLPEICIKAATPEVGCCSKCGAPWERVTETKTEYDWKGVKDRHPDKDWGNQGSHRLNQIVESQTLGWQPTCKCNAGKVPCLCLDPFMGAGTTLWVAKKLNRKAVGYEISEEYCELAVERNRQQVMV